MNHYEEKQENRRDYYLEMAEKAEREAEAVYNEARRMGDAIPFGQPILIGHHSEKRDRNYRDRMGKKYDKAFQLQDKAGYYRKKAESVGRAGISSDDPEAVAKVKEKLAEREKVQEQMKAANRVIRKKSLTDEQKIAELVNQGIAEVHARELLKPDFCGRIGFADYKLQNNNAEIRRLKKRIEELEQQSQLEQDTEDQDHGSFKITHEDNRVQFHFDGKPAEEVRNILKGHAFKWSPSRMAWVRMLNGNGLFARDRVIEALKKLES